MGFSAVLCVFPGVNVSTSAEAAYFIVDLSLDASILGFLKP